MTPSAAGKGDDSRPLSVSYEEYAANWDLAFGKKPEMIELQSTDSYDSSLGRIYIVPNPRDTMNGDWGWLQGQKVKLDGEVVTVRAIEAYCIGGVYRAGKPIGILTDKVEEGDRAA